LCRESKAKIVAVYKCPDEHIHVPWPDEHIRVCYHGLIDRVGGLIRKDAGGQAGNNFDHANFMCGLQHVIIDVDVVSLEGTDTSVLTKN